MVMLRGKKNPLYLSIGMPFITQHSRRPTMKVNNNHLNILFLSPRQKPHF